MLIITDADIMAAVHQNHENAQHRTVLYINPRQPEPSVPEKVQEGPVPDPIPSRVIPGYTLGLIVRFGLALGFEWAAARELMHPTLGAILGMACVLWAVAYWVEKRWDL